MNTEAVPRFLDKWITPSMLLSILGGIIWGVQLNFTVLQLTENVAANRTKIENQEKVNFDQTVLLSKVSLTLDNVQKKLDKIDIKIERLEHTK